MTLKNPQPYAFAWATLVSLMDAAVIQSGQSLKASDTLLQLQQAPLPSKQWQIEVARWFNTGLAAMQQNIQEVIVGLPTKIEGTVAAPFYAPERCQSQLTRDTQGTVSFSVL